MKIALPILFLIKSCLVFAQAPRPDSLKMAVEMAVQKNDRLAQAELLRELAWEQANAGSALEALENAQRAIAIFGSLGRPFEAHKTTSVLLIVHQQLHNGDKILEYALPALEFARSVRDSPFIARTLGAVGIGFDEKKEYGKALAHYLEEIKMEESIGESTAVAHLNASSSSTLIGNFDEGLGHANICIQQSEMEGDTGTLIYGQMAKAFALVKNGRAAEAAEAVAVAEKLASGMEDVNLSRDLSLIKSLVHAGQGDFRQAYFQHKKFYEMDSTLSSLQRNAQFAALETIYGTQKKEAENALLNLRVHRQKRWLLGILGASFLLGAMVWLQRKRLKINAKLLETEKMLVETERQRLTDEKAFHQGNLDNFAQSLREKNSVIESLKNDLENQIQITPAIKLTHTAAEKEHLLDQLTQATILTEEQWRSFRQKFELVHVGFFQKFGQAVADATDAEYRLAALTKLEMTNTEIASMLGISPESVIKTRYRLRKKLGSEGLAALVQTL